MLPLIKYNTASTYLAPIPELTLQKIFTSTLQLSKFFLVSILIDVTADSYEQLFTYP